MGIADCCTIPRNVRGQTNVRGVNESEKGPPEHLFDALTANKCPNCAKIQRGIHLLIELLRRANSFGEGGVPFVKSRFCSAAWLRPARVISPPSQRLHARRRAQGTPCDRCLPVSRLYGLLAIACQGGKPHELSLCPARLLHGSRPMIQCFAKAKVCSRS